MEFRMNETTDTPKVSETENREMFGEARERYDLLMEDSDLPEDPSCCEQSDIEAAEYDERGFRPLTEKEKQELREKTNWPDKAEGIDGCRINDEGVIKYPCRNEWLAGKKNPITGVKYERRIVIIERYRVEVVMPTFESEFDAQLPDEICLAKDKEQFKECNKQLYEAIQKDPELMKKFTPEQIEQIEDGMRIGGAPDGYTWHHDAEKGKMQLIDSDMHGDSRHTGGRTLWGGGNDYRY